MVPDIAKAGHSFNGAMAYYLHDKRQHESEQHPQTAERVAWTATRNLATDDPETARRIMIATAQQADELKAQAGVKNTGRKSNAHVYAYSLAWHPDEAGQLDRAEMERAVDQSLQVIGAGQLQAVIVCHQDQEHPHVHVIVNRVDPQTGKMLSTSNDRLKLSDWANQYERERGLILTPKREEKRQLREQFAEQAQRRQYAAEKRQQEAQRPVDDKSPAMLLKALSGAQRDQHRQQWRDLSAANKSARDQIFADAGRAMKDAADRHKQECRPVWASYFRQARSQAQAFDAREKSIAGVIRNAMEATTQQRLSGQLGNRGTLSATFSNVLSSQARAAAFAQRQELNRGQMARALKTALDTEIRSIKEQRDSQLVAQRQAFGRARASLIERQDLERDKIRQAWQQVPRDRGADRQHDRSKPYRQRWQNAVAVQEQKPMKRTFERTTGMEVGRLEKAPTVTRFISQAEPAPSPSGDVPKPAPKAAQQVPAKQLPPAPQQSPATSRGSWQEAAKKPVRDPRADFAANKQSISAPVKDAAYWQQRAKDARAAEKQNPSQTRDKSRDYDRER